MLCRYCGKDFSEEHFELANVLNGIAYRRRKCRRCYQDTKNERKDRIRSWILEYKKDKKCENCGINDPRVLEFHHQDPSQKEFNVGDIIRNGKSIENLRVEIDKCIVLCANCHRIIHWEESHQSVV